MNFATHANPETLTAWLELMHLADSALPIGALAHSFGLESLTAERGLNERDLAAFFAEWLHGIGHTEAVFVRRAHAIRNEAAWHALNAEASAFRPARESREASLSLGRRFLKLAATLIPDSRLKTSGPAHLSTAFGLVGSAIGIPAELATAAFLHQSLFGAVSASQRLLPFGQTAAMHLLWQLKPRMAEVIRASSTATPDDLWTLQPTLEIASMRHPQLGTRLFIS